MITVLRIRILRSALVSALIAVTTVVAEAPFSFTATPGKLPKDAVPRKYTVTLKPDAAALTTEGDVVIDVEVLKPTPELVFNALDLEIPSATVDGVEAGAPTLNPAEQTATLRLASPLSPGRHTIRLPFRGRISRHPVGFYAEKYQVQGVEKVLLGTQMEPTDARRMFPCWDEPVFRAVFQLTVSVPEGQAAVSNTPITGEGPVSNGRRWVTFGATPPMASYLVVLCVGELESLTGEVDGVKLAIWTTAGKSAQGAYALEATRRIVHFYNDYFGVKYPLPKLDQIAIPGGFMGAMENWGGITYNESVLLFDPATSSQETREQIFGIVAHEIAHQWFGNLVTMAWWDNLWLNEGFASWMGTKCTDRLNPEWKVWLRSNAEKENAMDLDARRSTHPIQQPVQNESQAMDAFDAITYIKGQSFIRMLEGYLGEADFRTGIRGYMGRHAYGSTTTADLWTALEAASGKPVASLAEGWTTLPGFPVISVSTQDRNGRLELALTQERFLLSGNGSAGTPWSVPLTVGAAAGSAPAAVLFSKASETLPSGEPASAAIKVNVGNTGYYRAAYAPDLVRKQAAAFPSFSEDDRVNLLSDAWAMVQAGRSDIATYLELVQALGPSETSLAVWERVMDSLEFLRLLEQGTAGESAFHAWAAERLRIPFARLGWQARPGESSNDGVLRAALIPALGFLEDAAVIAEARARFARFLTDPTSLAPDLRTPVCLVVGRNADPETWERLRALAKATDSTEEKDRFYRAFQLARDVTLARRTLDLSLSEERPFAQWYPIALCVAQEHPDLAWEFAKAHAQEFVSRIPDGGAFVTRNTYFGRLAESSTDAARAADLEATVLRVVGTNAVAETAKVSERIRFKAAFKSRELPPLDRWIAAARKDKVR